MGNRRSAVGTGGGVMAIQHAERNVMKHSIWLAALAAILVSGCATSVPEARTFPHAEQKKALSVRHWGMIAEDGVERTRQAIARAALTQDKPLFIADRGVTDFDHAFRNYMVSGLVNAGLPVAAHPQGAVEIQYETQVIRHAAFDPLAAGYKPGTATAGVAGLWVLRDAFRTWPSGSAAAATIAGAAGLDAYRARNPGETGVELLLTISVIQDGRYAMRSTDAYYIEKGDAHLFQACDEKFWRRTCH